MNVSCLNLKENIVSKRRNWNKVWPQQVLNQQPQGLKTLKHPTELFHHQLWLGLERVTNYMSTLFKLLSADMSLSFWNMNMFHCLRCECETVWCCDVWASDPVSLSACQLVSALKMVQWFKTPFCNMWTWDRFSARASTGMQHKCVSVCLYVCVQNQIKSNQTNSKKNPSTKLRPLRSFVAPPSDGDRIGPGGNSEQVSPVELASLIKAS